MIATSLVNVFNSQIGVEENPRGSNWGDAVKGYLKSVGIASPAYWCMAFNYWAIQSYCDANKYLNPLKKTGGVLDQWNFCKAYATTAKPGAMFILDYKNGSGHTGIVTAVEGANVITIEGNTNNNGSANGYGVFARKRSISGITHFIDLPKMIEDKNQIAQSNTLKKK